MPTVLILGASVAGLPIAHALLKNNTSSSNKTKVILVNPSRDFFWMIAAPRILTKPAAFRAEQYLIPIEPGFSGYPKEEFEFVHGAARAVDFPAKTVSVALSAPASEADGPAARTIEYGYDHLVLATGSTTPSSIATPTESGGHAVLYPFKPPPPSTSPSPPPTSLGDLIATAQSRISQAKRIVIGGAGPIGLETAGELADLPHKPSITLISAAARVLPGSTEGASRSAETQLASKGVYVITRRKVVGYSPEEGVVRLDNGETLSTDVYIPTTGVLPNTSYLPAGVLDEKGWVNVDEELRVRGVENVYAAGDITSYPARLAQRAGEQAGIVAHNLVVEIGGGGAAAGKRKRFAPGRAMMVVPIGAAGGTGELWFGWVPFVWLVRLVKGRDFFIAKAKSLVYS
ncbi:FAD/NAD(P)-binding domain-containing protein [Aspergillus japonicus CBS 114.51]|uniref:FAD/NAD(P)-binding domain-containing protein n=1 Tax=Aspergillus japonicus CBS 114.51 TaxID=1448312 RepID=A0A8T8WVX9_ASPJA|nr:FAD/NAD(P)-binding domain-containing protein [Aspergillus japonicus CBS 114.51]RAH79981.1 FAD/NAD(P)-binding domain-containing protein [Aspergillus japonicus CBS 114.51]